MAPIIRTVNLSKVYRVGNEKVIALNDVNLAIEPVYVHDRNGIVAISVVTAVVPCNSCGKRHYKTYARDIMCYSEVCIDSFAMIDGIARLENSHMGVQFCRSASTRIIVECIIVCP